MEEVIVRIIGLLSETKGNAHFLTHAKHTGSGQVEFFKNYKEDCALQPVCCPRSRPGSEADTLVTSRARHLTLPVANI